MRIGVVVEGHGEVGALPVLLRRIAHTIMRFDVEVAHPVRIGRSRLGQRYNDFEKAVRLAVVDECDAIMVVLDADDDCPADLAKDLVQRAAVYVGKQPVSVVIANREYECWFLAAIESLRGRRGIKRSACTPERVEEIRGAKEKLQSLMEEGHYSETVDQPALSALLDIEQAKANSASFRKLCRDMERMLRSAG